MNMIKYIFSAMMVMSFLMMGSQAHAQSDSPTPKVPPKRTVYNFEEIDILGDVKKPIGESIVKAPEFRFKKLLNLDESFLPNISKAVDEY
ncbi:MAG: hypothetical protein R3A11_01165 [Bdellovibrionota bacterium]